MTTIRKVSEINGYSITHNIWTGVYIVTELASNTEVAYKTSRKMAEQYAAECKRKKNETNPTT